MFLHFDYIFNIKVVHAHIHSHITLTGPYRILQKLFNILRNSHKTIKTVSCMGDAKIEQITLTNRSKNVARDVTKFKHFVIIHRLHIYLYITQPVINVNLEMKTNRKPEVKHYFKKKRQNIYNVHFHELHVVFTRKIFHVSSMS